MTTQINTLLFTYTLIAWAGIYFLVMTKCVDEWKEKHIKALSVPMEVLMINHPSHGKVERYYPIEGSIKFGGN